MIDLLNSNLKEQNSDYFVEIIDGSKNFYATQLCIILKF